MKFEAHHISLTDGVPYHIRDTPATDPVEDADSTSDDDSSTTMQISVLVLIPSAHKTLPPETPISTTVPVTNRDLTVNAATLSDLLTQPSRTQSSRTQSSRTQSSRTLPSRSTTSALHSSDESNEDVSVGTSSPSRKCHYLAADFLNDTSPTTPNDSTTRPAPSQTIKTKTDKSKKKTKDQNLLKSSTKKKTNNEMI
ncbi:uncharacterized protein [Procambarus clarkii]|uniref:uncharacterized protein n=1 Tax=Procambarus clarkii TaxID=6728 RepID=UPI00374217F8